MGIKKLVKPLAFLAILAVLWQVAVGILEKPRSEMWDATGLSYIYENRNLYDVIVCGTSMALTNISVEELYTEYGIAAATIGEPSQSMFLTYYSLEEALKYQNPQVVILDVENLFYTQEWLEEQYTKENNYLHYSLDRMRNGLTKYHAFREAQAYNPNLDFWNYFSKMYYRHSNWEDLGEENFVRDGNVSQMNGNPMMLTINEDYAEGRSVLPSEVENDGRISKIYEQNREYLEKIVTLCEKKGITLLLVRSKGLLDWNWMRYNATMEIAEEHGLTFLDMNLLEGEMEFDWGSDMHDDRHYNVSGAKKWTDLLGDYLTENFAFSDRRGDSRCAYLEEQEGLYFDFLEAMEAKLSLNGAVALYEYLDVLCSLDREDNVILFAGRDDVATGVTEELTAALNSLGLAADLVGKGGCSYLALVDGERREELLDGEAVTLEGELEDGTGFLLGSVGYEAKEETDIEPSIKIDGKEYIKKGTGLNIVVYNKPSQQVIGSVCFGTDAY